MSKIVNWNIINCLAKGGGDSNNPKTEMSRNGKSETAKKKD